MRFPGQHSGERIILLLRRHPFVFAVILAYFVLLVLLPIGVRLLLSNELLAALAGTVWEPLGLLALTAYYLFLWLFLMFAWIDYYLDLWIVTDERIVNIEQSGLFDRVISEQRLIRVQDVTSEVKGLFPTFLNYGNVHVQTAGSRERFVFEQVPEPDLVKKVVLQAHESALSRTKSGPAIEASLV